MAGLYSGDLAYLYGSNICKSINDWRKQVARKLISFNIDSILSDVLSLPSLPKFSWRKGMVVFKNFQKNCFGLDVHKAWIYACIGSIDTNGRTEYKQARFSRLPTDFMI